MPTRKIKILDETYTLSVPKTKRFNQLENQEHKLLKNLEQDYQTLQQMLHERRSSRPRIFRIFRSDSKDSRLKKHERKLDKLVSIRKTKLTEFQAIIEDYQTSLRKFAFGAQNAMNHTHAKIRALGEQCLADGQAAQVGQNMTEQRRANERSSMLMQYGQELGQTACLIIENISLYQETLTLLTQDTQEQQEELIQLVKYLERYRQEYDFDQRMLQVREEIDSLKETALHVMDDMRDYLTPLQDLIDQKVQIDSSLHPHLTEIKTLRQNLIAKEGIATFVENELFDEHLLSLTRNQRHKERLPETWERLASKNSIEEILEIEVAIATNDNGDIIHTLEALDSINILTRIYLLPFTLPRRQSDEDLGEFLSRSILEAQKQIYNDQEEYSKIELFVLVLIYILKGQDISYSREREKLKIFIYTLQDTEIKSLLKREKSSENFLVLSALFMSIKILEKINKDELKKTVKRLIELLLNEDFVERIEEYIKLTTQK